MTSFKASYGGIGEMLRSPEMAAEMGRRAELVKDRAEATAPYDASAPARHYRDDFSVEVTTHGGIHKDRAEGAVTNTSEHAFFVEYLNGDRTLGRALDAAGG